MSARDHASKRIVAGAKKQFRFERRSLVQQAIHDFEILYGERAAVREALGVAACCVGFLHLLLGAAIMIGGAQ
jgi:hypothetical protein